MRLLMVDPFGRGGIGRYAYELSGELARGGDVLVEVLTSRSCDFAVQSGSVQYQRVLEAFDSQSHLPVAARRALSALLHSRNTWHLFKNCTPSRHDLLHIVWPPIRWAKWLVPLWARRMPVVVTVHNVLPHEGEQRRVSAAWYPIYDAAHVLVCHSPHTVDELRALFGERVAHKAMLAPLPVNQREWGVPSTARRAEARAILGFPQESPIMLCFGAIRSYKGLDVVLDALPTVLKTVPGARLAIVGRCDDWAPYERRIEELGVAGAVDARIGWVPEELVPEYVAATDAVVLPYERIDGSAVAMSAALMAVPMVLSDIPGFTSVWRKDEAFFCARTPEGVANALIDSITSEEATARAARARQRATTEMTWEASAAIHRRAYDEALERFHREATA